MRWGKHLNRLLRVLFLGALAALPFLFPLEGRLLLPALGLFFLGALMRLWANGVIEKGLRVACEGPYALQRHPMYLGTVPIIAGWLLAWELPWAWRGAAVALFLVIAIWRAAQEEVRLRVRLPDYAEYARRVPAFFPSPGSVLRAVRDRTLFANYRWRRLWMNREILRMLVALVALAAIWVYREVLVVLDRRAFDPLTDIGATAFLIAMAGLAGFVVARATPEGLRTAFAELRTTLRARRSGREAWKEPEPPPAPVPAPEAKDPM